MLNKHWMLRSLPRTQSVSRCHCPASFLIIPWGPPRILLFTPYQDMQMKGFLYQWGKNWGKTRNIYGYWTKIEKPRSKQAGRQQQGISSRIKLRREFWHRRREEKKKQKKKKIDLKWNRLKKKKKKKTHCFLFIVIFSYMTRSFDSSAAAHWSCSLWQGHCRPSELQCVQTGGDRSRVIPGKGTWMSSTVSPKCHTCVLERQHISEGKHTSTSW